MPSTADGQLWLMVPHCLLQIEPDELQLHLAAGHLELAQEASGEPDLSTGQDSVGRAPDEAEVGQGPVRLRRPGREALLQGAERDAARRIRRRRGQL